MGGGGCSSDSVENNGAENKRVTGKEEDKWNNNSHPSLSSWCEGNVDESSVVLCPLPCFVSSVLRSLVHVAGWMAGWRLANCDDLRMGVSDIEYFD